MLNVYLDVETDWNRQLTVVGFRSAATGLVQLIGRDISRARLLRVLPRDARLYTFNGHCFDLPCIHAQLGIDLRSRYESVDLRWAYHRLGYRGGQKAVEAMLGVTRRTEGLDGRDAVRLYHLWRGGDVEALRLLLRYNAEDVNGLVRLRRRLTSVRMAPAARAAHA